MVFGKWVGCPGQRRSCHLYFAGRFKLGYGDANS